MPETIHDEPTSIIETHLGTVVISSGQLEQQLNARQTMFLTINSMRATALTDEIIDRLLDQLIVRARPMSGFASLFLQRVKDGRA